MAKSGNIGLVFSGGGARGAYQVGAWQAMIELGIVDSVSDVYGTSVGAINGAAFVQGDIALTKDLWLQLTYNKVFAEMPQDKLSFKARRAYFDWIKGAIKKRGMDVSPLKEILRNSIQEHNIRDGGKSYGLVVYDLANRKPLYLNMDEIPTGKLVEFIIASSTFPTFQPHRIDGKLYLDGGVSDNRPMQFFTPDTNVDLVICIDVTAARHLWPTKGTEGNHEVFFIRPSKLLGSPLAFSTDKINANFQLGYDDARRQLGAYFAVV